MEGRSPTLSVLQEIAYRHRRVIRRPGRLLFSTPAICLLFVALSTCSVYFSLVHFGPKIVAQEQARAQRRSMKHFMGKFDPSMDPDLLLANRSVSFWAQDLAERRKTRFLPVTEVAPPSPSQMFMTLNKTEQIEMRFVYQMDEKALPYIGSPRFLNKFERGTRAWYNTLSTFHDAGKVVDGIRREHGWLGVTREGRRVWNPDPLPPSVWHHPAGYEAAMKHGGFYLNLSNALPLDRGTVDNRGSVCSAESYDYTDLPDASIIITYYNEPFSTLMRTVHSVLNQTPAPILTEVIVVDDHSNDTTTKEMVEDYIKYLPKTKLIRLGERRGLVNARLAGARSARGEVLVILDSHVEVNTGWLEPQLKRIKEQRTSIVFPQILSIDPETFDYDAKSGIGCRISFRWSMQEQSSLAGPVTDPSPVPSPSMAGGLFAVDRDYFWYLGGYDNGFSMWGAENVEMGFRTWLCGGHLECTPCAMTYHIYRKKGAGYETPHEHVVRNRLRTARLWTDDYFPIAKIFITNLQNPDVGNLDEMIELKERLQCKPFQWFLDNVDKEPRDIMSPSSIVYFGEVRNNHPFRSRYCLDTMSNSRENEFFGVFPCHGEGGTQSWVALREIPHILPVANDRLCLSSKLQFIKCKSSDDAINFDLVPVDENVLIKSRYSGRCLSISPTGPANLSFETCDPTDKAQVWTFPPYVHHNEAPLAHTETWLAEQALFKNQTHIPS